MSESSGKKKLVKDISANTLQTAVTQVFGLLIFYLTSKYLTKNDFGEFNWSMAVGATVIAVASLGLDLVFVKRIASSQNILVISGVHFFHTLVSGLVLCAIVFAIKLFVPEFSYNHPVFFYVFISLAIANMANSFKLCLNGLESYKQLALLSLCVNLVKFTGVIALYAAGSFNLFHLILIYIFTSIIEFVIAYYLMSKGLSKRVLPVFHANEYKYFILESLPQLGVVLFDSALARIDWILLGIISTSAITAEYSFAYKIFELSKLPLLVISPILLTRLSKLFSNSNELHEEKKNEIELFFRLELFVIMLIPIVLLCTWTPLVDFVTNNKYGQVNEVTFWILSACIPMHAIINFLWTVAFVKQRLKKLMYITISASLLNIAGNCVLIPKFNGMGAALAFLLSTIFQLGLYFWFLKNDIFKMSLPAYVASLVNAGVAVIIARVLFDNIFMSTPVALLIYFILTFISGQLSFRSIQKFLARIRS